MMKLNIEKDFIDRISGERHRVGDIIEVDKTRGEELLADKRNLVSINTAAEEEPKPKKSTKKK